jgi:hypothetical protein
MPKGKAATNVGKVAERLGVGHIWCPACSHKIKISKLVAWYLESIISEVAKTGNPIRIMKLGTFFLKNGMVRWRQHDRLIRKIYD